jgi:hypothetical protein
MVLNDTVFKCKFINKIQGSDLSKNCFAEKCVISLFKYDGFNWFDPESFDSVDLTLLPDEEFKLTVIKDSTSVYDRYFCEIATKTKKIKGYTDFITDDMILLHSSLLALPELKDLVFLEVDSEDGIKVTLMNWMLFPQCHLDERSWMADKSVFSWF